ncbi:MAG: hypothetical protein K8F91_05905, partial [Candidatus Obscuribacterales bacterium]|nr:hypothetical protein [Candidatus Obscuribacterales bacterium]
KDSEPVDKKKDEKSEPFKSEAEPIKAEEAEPESKKSEPEPEAKEPEKEEPEATREKEDDEEDDPVAASVKSLLEPLEDELAASKAMIDEALKKAEPESNIALEEVSEPEPPPESKAEEEAGEVKTKFEEEPEPQEEISTSHAEPEEAVSASESEDSPEPESAPESKSDEAKASKNETLEKFAGIIDDSSSGPADDDSGGSKEPTEPVSSAVEQEDESISENANEGATNGTDKSMTMTVEKMVAIKVPDWCKRYFSNELKGLGKELEELNDQIKKTESRIKEIEGQTALTKGLRNTLLTCEDDDLIEACKKVLSLVGWKVTQSEEDKNELLLENDDDRVAIARIIWTKNNAERSHLGQLSISQTRFWCEKGTEPKGVLIVGKITDTEPSDPSETADQELTDYAGKKNVCLMSTLQLLAIYRDLALSDGNSNALRKSIHDCKGWLDGYTLEPGDEILEDDDDKDSSKSKSLSSLLSA